MGVVYIMAVPALRSSFDGGLHGLGGFNKALITIIIGG